MAEPLTEALPDPANDETLTMTGYQWWRYRRIIEQEAASAAVAEVDRLREALEPFAAAFTADRMPVTRRSAYEAVAALIAESREEGT